jgi:excisionase family DNA binding protein
VAPPAYLNDMSNHTIATPITTWADLRASDREVLNRSEVAALLTLDPRTVDHAIQDGTIPAVHVGRRVLIPRRPFLRAFSVDDEAPA